MNFPINYLASLNLTAITLVLLVKLMHYLIFKSKTASFETYLYYDLPQVIANGSSKITSRKRFQNRLSGVLLSGIILQIIFSILFIISF